MKLWVHLGLVVMIFALFIVSLIIGPSKIPPLVGLNALFESEGDVLFVVMREIRLPRALLSILIGFALGMAGAAMQGFLRNPLAEPGVIGISAASALGAVVALQTGFALEGIFLKEAIEKSGIEAVFALPIAAMLGALLAAILLMIFGRGGKSEQLILVGIGISAIAGALTSLVLNLSPNPFAALEIMFWMMGSVSDRSMMHVMMAFPFIIMGSLMLLSIAKGLDALSLGEDTAHSLGVNMRQMRFVIIFAVTIMVGASVAVAGTIGFVGLIVPHILRPIVGAKPSNLLLPSAFGGAALLTLADILIRVIAPERDLKLGVLTALIGAPIFLHLVLKSWKAK